MVTHGLPWVTIYWLLHILVQCVIVSNKWTIRERKKDDLEKTEKTDRNCTGMILIRKKSMKNNLNHLHPLSKDSFLTYSGCVLQLSREKKIRNSEENS